MYFYLLHIWTLAWDLKRWSSVSDPKSAGAVEQRHETWIFKILYPSVPWILVPVCCMICFSPSDQLDCPRAMRMKDVMLLERRSRVGVAAFMEGSSASCMQSWLLPDLHRIQALNQQGDIACNLWSIHGEMESITRNVAEKGCLPRCWSSPSLPVVHGVHQVLITTPSVPVTGSDKKPTVPLVKRRRRRPNNNLKDGVEWADEKYFVDWLVNHVQQYPSNTPWTDS